MRLVPKQVATLKLADIGKEQACPPCYWSGNALDLALHWRDTYPLLRK
jgi:hypothetical protein